jgi:hypothetical protein
MLKEKSPLLNIEIKNEKSLKFNNINDIFECLYELYDFMLDNPIENIWYECLSIVISYFQLISLMFDKIVSIINIIKENPII